MESKRTNHKQNKGKIVQYDVQSKGKALQYDVQSKGKALRYMCKHIKKRKTLILYAHTYNL